MPITPMFPLGSVLLPGNAVPLRIFEPRFQRLLADVLADDGTFGVVLIERGHEVGGGDTRFGVGTLAHVEQHRELEENQYAVVAVGLRRIRIESWLDDAPYPRAQVANWPDDVDHDPSTTQELYESCTAKLRRFLAFAAELGKPVAPATFDAPAAPSPGSNALSALAPLGPLDRQQLLESPNAAARLRLLSGLIDEQLALVQID